MFVVQAVHKRDKSISLDLANRQEECLHPRGSDGEQRIQAHPRAWLAPALSSGIRSSDHDPMVGAGV